MAARGAKPGNKNATKGKLWNEAIRKALAQYESKEKGIQRGQALFKIAWRIVDEAIDGNEHAWTEIGNRLDGKPVQAIIGDDDGPPIRIEGRIKLVKPE